MKAAERYISKFDTVEQECDAAASDIAKTAWAWLVRLSDGRMTTAWARVAELGMDRTHSAG